MASGLGKTVTAAFDIRKWLKSRPKSKVLYLCHQNDILSQARARFQMIIGGDDRFYGCYHGTEKSRHAKFLFASFQTMREKFRRFDRKEFDYVVVDESHHVPAATYFPVVSYFRPKFLLGMTATPDRTDMRDTRTLFGNEVYSLDLGNALARGLLTKVDYRLLTDEIVELGRVENPYKMSLSELNKKIFVPKRDKEIVEIVKRKIASVKNPRAMIFCPSIHYTEELRKHIPDAVPVHSNLSKRLQEARIQEFRDGSLNIILTVDKFNEGIDIPEVNVVVFLRSTQSKTVFYQQLGRGLRKVTDKNRVLVLDFIANCERLRMISELVEFARQVSGKHLKHGKYKPKETLVVNGGSFKFTEKAKNVLDILEKVKIGYTPEVLIEQLQNEARRLGHTPSFKDVQRASKEGRMVSTSVYIKKFGSYNNVLVEAKLPQNMKYEKYSKSELIEQLKNEAKLLGRTPTKKDIEKASMEKRMASFTTIQNAYDGSINNALRTAGLIINNAHNSFTRREIIEQIKREAQFLKRTPNGRDLRRASLAGRCASSSAIIARFGSINKSILVAGYFPRYIKRSNSKLISDFKKLTKKLRKIPTFKEMEQACRSGECADPSTYVNRFGSMKTLLKKVGAH